MALEAAMVVISVISAIIAATSAVMAYRVRIQTRTDIFESHRDALILAMAENDNRAEYLVLHSTLLQEKLSRLLAKEAKLSLMKTQEGFSRTSRKSLASRRL